MIRCNVNVVLARLPLLGNDNQFVVDVWALPARMRRSFGLNVADGAAPHKFLVERVSH